MVARLATHTHTHTMGMGHTHTTPKSSALLLLLLLLLLDDSDDALLPLPFCRGIMRLCCFFVLKFCLRACIQPLLLVPRANQNGSREEFLQFVGRE